MMIDKKKVRILSKSEETVNKNAQTDKRDYQKNRLGYYHNYRYAKLRKMLSTAALSVALISWYTTANGLHQYTFDSIWQAYIISAALQGALFALSINGIKLFLGLDSKIKKGAFILVWCSLLVASSIFSYVYISKDVYSDKLLREDANRILNTYCLKKNYELSAAADSLLNGTGNDVKGLIDEMNSYIDKLAILENGIDFSEEGSDEQINNLRSSLLPYAYTYYSENHVDEINIIDGCIDTSNLIINIDRILTGRYTHQDLDDLIKETQIINAAIQKEITNVEKNKKEKIKERDDYQSRLETYTDINSPAYNDLVELLADTIDQIDNLGILISNMEVELISCNRVPIVLDSVEGNMASAMYNRVLQIHSAMNAEKIPIEEVQRIAEEINDILLENRARLPENDTRIEGYQHFRSNIRKYAAVVEAKELIDRNIELLYNIQIVNELSQESKDSILEDNDINDQIYRNIAIDENGWVTYWQDHLNSLKKIAQKLQVGGMNTNEINDLIETIEDRERLYLSDLNDFERAWGLLSSIHSYKILLVFSLIFAFGIDLFSVLISCLLHLFYS